jgi:hypothetical protein
MEQPNPKNVLLIACLTAVIAFLFVSNAAPVLGILHNVFEGEIVLAQGDWQECITKNTNCGVRIGYKYILVVCLVAIGWAIIKLMSQNQSGQKK